jgi:putative hydrolase of the HAD superfamily
MIPLRALLLDLDNTVYAYAPCHDAGLRAAQPVAASLDPLWQDEARFRRDYDQARRTLKQQIGNVAAAHCRLLYFKTMLDRHWGRAALAATRQLHDAYWQGYFAVMRREPGCAELLHELRARGIRMAWVTNFTTERQFLKLRALDLEDTADFLITSEEAGAEKPRPETLTLALSRLQVAPADACLVGDGLGEDLGAAAAAGVTFVWYQRDERPPTTPPPTYAVRDWPDLRKLLLEA